MFQLSFNCTSGTEFDKPSRLFLTNTQPSARISNRLPTNTYHTRPQRRLDVDETGHISGNKLKLFDPLRQQPRVSSCTTHSSMHTFAGSMKAHSPSTVFAACELCVEKAKQHALFNRIWMPLCHYYPKCIFHDLHGSKRRQSHAAVECLA